MDAFDWQNATSAFIAAVNADAEVAGKFTGGAQKATQADVVTKSGGW